MKPRPFFLCDIDGTLADLSHRLHLIESKPANWDGFFAACPDDAPITPVITTVQLLADAGAGILMVTGRSDSIREDTTAWLMKHRIPFHSIFMRKHGDHRQDNVVKGELLDEIQREYGDQIIGAFEDRNQVVQMLRERGIKVFQVADGAF